MKTAPPTLPGIPQANSSPVKLKPDDFLLTSIKAAPACATIVLSCTEIWSISVKINVTPRIPPSLTIKLLAFPKMVNGQFFS